MNFDAFVWEGTAALAERLWSDTPLTPNATVAAEAARSRFSSLQCHWAFWNLPMFHRQASGSEYVAFGDTQLSDPCPADWCAVPTQ